MTARYVVFGNPIAHSLSPQIHTYFAQLCKQDMVYERDLVPEGEFASLASKMFKVPPKCLSIFAFLPEGEFVPCNITVPCKLDAYNFANTLTDYAKAAKAVNTLKRLEDGTILGDNTDGRGLLADLERLGCEFHGKRILIVGAGGAARGIILPLIEKNPEFLDIVNRNEMKAFELAKEHSGARVVLYSSLKPQYDIIINATSASLQGMLPPIADEVLGASDFVYDLMYKSDGKTAFVSKALALGVKHCHDGFGMLLGQAALSFELWRGVRPDLAKTYQEFVKRCGRDA